MSSNPGFFGDDEEGETLESVLKPINMELVERTIPDRVMDPPVRPAPQPLDPGYSDEWIPGQKPVKENAKNKPVSSPEEKVAAVKNSINLLKNIVILGVVGAILAGIGFFVYWLTQQYSL